MPVYQESVTITSGAGLTATSVMQINGSFVISSSAGITASRPVAVLNLSQQFQTESEVIAPPKVTITGSLFTWQGEGTLDTFLRRLIRPSHTFSTTSSLTTSLVRSSSILFSASSLSRMRSQSVTGHLVTASVEAENLFTPSFFSETYLITKIEIWNRARIPAMIPRFFSLEMASFNEVTIFDLSPFSIIEFPELYNILLEYTPEVLRENKDYTVFLNLISRSMGDLREKIAHLPSLKDPEIADPIFFPILAKILSYMENYDLPREVRGLFLEKRIDILRRKASPDLIKAAFKYKGRPERILTETDTLEDMSINIKDWGVYEILYQDNTLSPSYEYIRPYKQAGVRVYFSFISLMALVQRHLASVELSNPRDFKSASTVNYQMFSYFSEMRVLPNYVLKRHKIWGSPALKTGNLDQKQLDSYVYVQPDIEVIQE